MSTATQTPLPSNSDTPLQSPPAASTSTPLSASVTQCLNTSSVSSFSIHNSAFAPAPYSTITPKPIHWLWPARIPRGKITLLIGDPGSGKSLLTLDLAARLSRGTDFPEPATPQQTPQSPATPSPEPTPDTQYPTPDTPPQSSLLLTAEDDPADTIHPRLQAANADLSKIHHLPSLTTLIPSENPADNPLAILESAIQSIPDLALLVIDPITSFLGYTDRIISRNNNKTVLSALADLAARYNIALILTARLNKAVPDGQAVHSLHRAVGSLAFSSAARAIHLLLAPSEPTILEPDPYYDDAISGIHRAKRINNPHLFIPIKINAAHKPLPLAFQIQNMRLDWPSIPDPAALLADAVLQEVVGWLRAALVEGPIRSDTIHKEARENAIPHRTLIRAKRYLGVERTKVGFNGLWFWRLLGDERRPANELDRIMVKLATPID